MNRHADPVSDLMVEIRTYLAAFPHAGISSVVDGIDRWATGEPAPVTPKRRDACRHLDAALAHMANRSLAAAIARAGERLFWTVYDAYDPAAIGRDFAEGHAFASIIGEGAMFPAVDFDLGLFIIAPGVFYRDHHHKAPELYAPLTGPHGWRFAPDVPLTWMDADEPVWNAPWQPHATKVGSVPFLCIFAWTRDVNEPAVIIPASDWPSLEQHAQD